MATMGYLEQTAEINNLFFACCSPNKFPGFKVISFKEGIVEIEPLLSSCIEDTLDTVMGCFEPCSNFLTEISKVFGCDETNVFKGIRFTHYGITIVVTVDTTNKYLLLSEYWKQRFTYLAKEYNLTMLSLLEKGKVESAD